MSNWQQPVKTLCEESRAAALARQCQLTKPPGSLGRLEQLAVDFAGWQGVGIPQMRSAAIRVFAADHGVVKEGVSAFPQSVTAEMVRNFSRGGAAITVLARQLEADFSVINLGTVEPLEDMPGLSNSQIAPGSGNIAIQPAMTERQLQQAMEAGANSVPLEADIFIGGEMGIGNTTSAAALICALLSLPADEIVGRGTGVDDAGLERKTAVVEKALTLHSPHCSTALESLRRLGGFEIAALTGAFIHCAQRGVPVLVDGFIASAAALVAVGINPGVKQWMLFGHCSKERGHRQVLEHLQVKPLLDLQMHLGEGTGAAVALPVLLSALKLHAEMATFAEASVSGSLG